MLISIIIFLKYYFNLFIINNLKYNYYHIFKPPHVNLGWPFPFIFSLCWWVGLGTCLSILFFYAWLLSFCFRSVHFYRLVVLRQLGTHFYRRINLKSLTETYQYSCPVVFTQFYPFKIFDHCWNTFLLVTTLINSFYPKIMTLFFYFFFDYPEYMYLAHHNAFGSYTGKGILLIIEHC